MSAGAHRVTPGFWLLLFLPVALGADQLLFDTAPDWQRWKLPLGAVELSEGGIIKPVRVRKNIDAVLDAGAFGGGIREAGSNQRDAGLVMDGDPTTGWSPDPDDPIGNWWIEIDLGRAVSVHQVRLIFAEEAPPFEIFDLLLSNGEQMLDNVLVPVPGTLVYRVREHFAKNKEHRVSFPLEQAEQSLVKNLRVQVLRAQPGARLVEIEVEAFGDNLAPGAQARGGGIEIAFEGAGPSTVTTGKTLNVVDGLVTTDWWLSGSARNPGDTFAHITLDLGATYWVDMVRLISWLGGPFEFKFYEVQIAEEALGSDSPPVWQKQFSGFGTETNQHQGLADHVFAPTPARQVRIFWRYLDLNCMESGVTNYRMCFASGVTQELQVYGEGYAREARLRSPLLDLGAGKNINLLRWQANTPPGTRIEFRSRTGNELIQQLTYRDKNGKEVTQKRWEKLVPSFQGPVDTTRIAGSDWSPWSRPYLLSGEAFQSPSPRRYLELEARLIADTPDASSSLDWLSVDFSSPLAQEVMGEIYPVEAKPGVEREFSYFLKAPATVSGFDRLSVEASTSLYFAAASLDDLHTQVEVEADSMGFGVRFPRPVHQGELVEIRFAAAIFLDATRFAVFLEDSQGGRQRVDPGDATARVASSTDIVRLPLSSGLFADLEIIPQILTPNGDGVNDELRVAFALVNVLEGRPLCLQLFDLSGRQVWAEEKAGLAGMQEFVWDGRGIGGKQVPPGMYILRLGVEGDARSERASRLVCVVY